MQIPENVKNIGNKLIRAGYESYIIGGAVRDWSFKITPSDYDLFSNATGEQILKLFPNGKIIGGEERQKKILTVVVGGVEISQFRSNGDRTEVGNTLEEHLSTCDFTLNAIAYNMKTEKIIDPHSGFIEIFDPDGKIIAVGDPEKRIKEDKLRAFRAVRFSAKFNMEIDKDLLQVIQKTEIDDISVERIREEILKIFQYKNSIRLLHKTGLLTQIFPEFLTLNVDGGRHHNEPVFEHCLMAHNNIINYTDNKLLIFAAPFHDVGKGYTIEYNKEKQSNTFVNHEIKGEKIIKKIMRRLKFSKEDIKYVSTLVLYHMSGMDDNMNNSNMKKLFRELASGGVDIHDMVLYQYCDKQANKKNDKIKFHEYLKEKQLLKTYHKLRKEDFALTVGELDINGYDLMKLGIYGSDLGMLLTDILEEVDAGLLRNKKKAILKYVDGY